MSKLQLFYCQLLSFILFLNFDAFVYGQEESKKDSLLKGNEILIDEEDKEILDDLFKNELLMLYDYANQFKYSNNMDDIIREFRQYDDIKYQLVLVMGLHKNADLKNSKVVDFLLEALGLSIYDLNLKETSYKKSQQRHFDSWKIRALAAYILSKNMDDFKSLDNAAKEKIISMLYQNVNLDRESRSKGLALITLSKLIASLNGNEETFFLKKKTLESFIQSELDFMMNKFYKFDQQNYFYCWTLVKSIGILKSHKFLFYLLYSFEKFNVKTKLESIRSVKAILASQGQQGVGSDSFSKANK